jgi:hypothetical protein
LDWIIAKMNVNKRKKNGSKGDQHWNSSTASGFWTLDISHMDWVLDLSPDVVEQMGANIRDVHIKEGRVWCKNLAWRQLRNLRKLRIIKPTSSWEIGNKDEFNGMVKLELLDLTGNITIQALPSLSGTTGLKTGPRWLHWVGACWPEV